MPRIFLGNFNFEHELARYGDNVSPAIPAAAARVRKVFGGPTGFDRSWNWLAIAAADDFIISPAHIDPHDFAPLAELGLPFPCFVHERRSLDKLKGMALIPWGWTASAVALGALYGWNCPAPPIDSVRQVNSREFRFDLEREWHVGLPGGALVASIDEIPNLLEKHGRRQRGWLLKANFGMSGREAVRGRGATLDEKTRNWARRRLAGGEPIVFEPCVERIAEAGIQIEIPREGQAHLAGVTPLLVDRSGVYRGSRFGCPASDIEVWQSAVETGLRAAQVARRAGYFGPLGIDAMRYRDENSHIRLRPMQDINARYTMGRLALGFTRLLPAGWCGTWIHFGARQLAGREYCEWCATTAFTLPAGVHVIPASPRRVGSQPAAHHAVCVLAPTPDLRRKTEAILFDSLGISVDLPPA